MKLLKAEEVKTANQQQITKDTLRTLASKKALKEVSSELDEANAKFELALANQHVRWAKEEEEALLTIQKLENEVKKLEVKKAQALIPIDIIKQNAYDLLKGAEKVMVEARSKDNEAELRLESLTDRLDEVGERETKVESLEQYIYIRQKNLILQEEGQKKLRETLQEKWSEYFAEVEKKSNEYSAKKKELELKEINLQSREESLQLKQFELDNQNKFIISQRAALEAAIKEKQNG